MTATNASRPMSTTTDALFYSPAFVIGFGDGYAGKRFIYPEGKRGPNPHLRSAQLAYERGRQFGVLWRGRSVADLTAMKAALQAFHDERLIT
ncbi:hypothetical protein [Hyphomicrobium sp. ghe19]|uniref:hypothetical protein n=1 Tax=Hyphomicrobium sp. ghe19 TaxID=2682968 RepID=UPI00136703EB|nr:hypothetical protein HYPP_03783 [Hyphomicrobium sp. ghe19]